MKTRHVIAGAGVAGMSALETLRALDPNAEIVLVCGEPAYSRMVLPYYLEGKIAEERVFTGSDDYYEQLGVEARLGVTLVGLDTAARRASLSDGSELAYDDLLLATGSSATRPPIPGADDPGVVNLWTLDDARRLLASPHSEAVIVGAGFIAFTILDGVTHLAKRVHMVEVEDQLLPHMLDARAAALLASRLRERGVGVHTGTTVEAIETSKGRRSLRLSGGDGLACDAVVLATGIRPNLEVARDAGIQVDRGIPVDGHMRTSAPGVYAAGDVAQGPILGSGETQVHAIQPTAVDHGRVAAANMAGVEVNYEGSLVMNILAAQGLEACSFGRWQDDGAEVTAVENASGHIYRKYVFEDDRLAGGILVGPSQVVSNLNDVGMMKGLVQTGVRLGPWKRYLRENPLDLRRAYVASGAAEQLMGTTLLAGRATGGGFRIPSLPARRPRSRHHATLVDGAPR